MIVRDPKESIACCLVFSPRDHGADHRDAWLYGVVIGWPPEALSELAVRHGWDTYQLARLQQLRAAFEALQPPPG